MAKHYSGRVHTIVFENSAQNFYILKITMDSEENSYGFPVTVKGSIPGLPVAVGAWIPFEAEEVQDPKYGRQLSIVRAPSVKKWDGKSASSILITYGLSGMVADRLLTAFKDDLANVLDRGDQDALLRVVSESDVKYILERWRVARSYLQTLAFLHDAGVPKAKASKVWSVFGDTASEVLSENPWALVAIDGISFAQADEVATRLGLTLDNPKRVEGAVISALRERRSAGHLFLRPGEMIDAVSKLIEGVSAPQMAAAINNLNALGRLVMDKTTRPGMASLYDPWMYRLECESARLLLLRAQTAVDTTLPEKFKSALGGQTLPDVGAYATAALEQWSKGSHITLSDAQRQGALNALTEPVSVLTGLPGTGKTTSLRAVVQISRDIGLRCMLIAPTGIAAKRMASVTGMEASTIHRAFGAKGWKEGRDERQATYVGVQGGADGAVNGDGSEEQWGSEEPFDGDLVVVDEASMMDQHLLYRILTCTAPRTRLVFIGDAAQLPSVGPGNVLRDLVASKVFPTTALKDIYRQADTSAIVLAAHAIHAGTVPDTQEKSEFTFVPLRDEKDILDGVLQYAKRLHDKKIPFQVMSPRHAGTVGVTNLNSVMRETLNPRGTSAMEVRLGSEVLREYDKIMVVKNDYKIGVFNGDVGTVTRIDLRAGEVEIEIEGPSPVRVRITLKDAVDMLRLAYAVTVHKMQGQESDVIIMPWIRGFHHQLQRNLLYTAITRAKKKVLLLGHWEAVERAVLNDQTDVRNTLFGDRLRL